MRYVLVIYTVVYGFPVNVEDIDGPQEFRHLQACISHALYAVPKLEALLRDATTTPDLFVNWRCERIKEEK